MLNRLKKSLVESYVGAIALGYLFADGIMRFAAVFSDPVSRWVMRGEFPGITDRSAASAAFFLKDALTELVTSFFLLLLGYILLRWLYFKPLAEKAPDAAANPEPPVLTPPAN